MKIEKELDNMLVAMLEDPLEIFKRQEIIKFSKIKSHFYIKILLRCKEGY